MQDQHAASQDQAAKAISFRRKVFYIPGYDPIHPRRYRELYRREGAVQSQISGYHLALQPKQTKGGYGWRVQSQIEGQSAEAQVEVLVWSDIVRSSMASGILATYGQMLRTAWIYLSTGALFRLMRLRKGPVIAALYPVVALLVQLLLACLIAWGLATLITLWLPPLFGLLALAAIPLVLRWFKAKDAKFYAYYLMHDYAHSARHRGALPPGLKPRLESFTQTLRQALTEDVDEVLVVGHSSGAHLGVQVLADLLRQDPQNNAPHDLSQSLPPSMGGALPHGSSQNSPDHPPDGLPHTAQPIIQPITQPSLPNGLPDTPPFHPLQDIAQSQAQRRPALAFLSLGQVVPMVSFLPKAQALRADLAYLSQHPGLTWVDVTAPGDGCAFALCDPVAVSGLATPQQRGPLILSAAFRQTLSPARWKQLRWKFFRLHFQYLCAFDRPKDYDYFQITAGAIGLKARFATRAPSKSRITTPVNRYTDI